MNNTPEATFSAEKLSPVVSSIEPLDAGAMAAARERQNQLTKPPGSLGRLEELSVQMAGIQGTAEPVLPKRKAVIVMAADHGVAEEGVSLFPQEVTPQMVLNFVGGGAGINVLSRHVGADVIVVDIGVAAQFASEEGIESRKISLGTKNMANGPAMTVAEAIESIMVGIDIARREIDNGAGMLATGDMGIANTTASAAITAIITGRAVEEVTGKGTGIDDEGLAHKVAVINRAISVNNPDKGDPIDVLAKVGGLEIGGLAGVILGAASRRTPVVIDGFISGAAALIACAIAPAAKGYVIPAHRSVEAGHNAVLSHLGLEPLLDLGLRLGEGTGGALAMTIVESAIKILAEMATFSQAGVSEAKS